MTDRQSNTLDMYVVVLEHYAANQTTIDAVVARATAYAALSTRVTGIRALIADQSGNISGVTQNKAALRASLDNLAIGILAPALVWARATDNLILAAEFNYPLSEIQKIKDDTIASFCNHRYALVNANIATMADYGITPAMLTAWNSAISNYEAVTGSPRSARVSRSVFTIALRTHFKEANALLKNTLDPLMNSFRTSDADLYNGYRRARIIIDRRGQNTGSISGKVSSAADSSPIIGAELSITPRPSTVLSGSDATYRFSYLPAGIYTVKCTAPGFLPADKTIVLTSSQTATADFVLIPA
jgi:hypothetical protein